MFSANCLIKHDTYLENGGSMEIKDQFFQMAYQNRLEVEPIQTSLFDLIIALQEEVYPFEDWIITEAVLELFETGQAKFVTEN
jgi:hypothetical protein